MVNPIRRVLIKHPKDAYRNQANVDHQYQQLNYCDVPDYKKSLIDYETRPYGNLTPQILLLPDL